MKISREGCLVFRCDFHLSNRLVAIFLLMEFVVGILRCSYGDSVLSEIISFLRKG